MSKETKILKYPIEADGPTYKFKTLAGAQLLHVESINDQLYAFAAVRLDQAPAIRTLAIVTVGGDVPPGTGPYLGAGITLNGAAAFMVFDDGEEIVEQEKER